MSLAGFSKEYRYRLALEKIEKMSERIGYPSGCTENCLGDCGACVAARMTGIARAALKGDE